MENLTDLHRRTLDATSQIVAGIRPDQWTAPTPCEGWDVRTLTNHVIGGNLWAAALAAGKNIDQVGTALDGDLLGDDPVASYRQSADAAAAAFESPGALDAPCAVSYGPVPGSVYAGHRIIDVFIHGWDLAVATGQDTRLNTDLIAASTQIVEPQLDGLRASGAFGHAIQVPADADAQTQLLSWLGRHPTTTDTRSIAS
jgi:uncharacterized protein (TIGR03086 family)